LAFGFTHCYNILPIDPNIRSTYTLPIHAGAGHQ
jgi:hypothetical protein